MRATERWCIEKGKPLSDLVIYDEACRAIAAAVSVDEVKTIRDKSEAMRCYAKQAMNLQLETDASEIRFRAERRLGQMIGEQKSGPGLAKPGPKIGAESAPNYSPTLSEALGMPSDAAKKLSSRAQTLAGISDKAFERHLGDWREEVDESSRVATGKFYNKVKLTSKPKGQLDEERAEIRWHQGLIRHLEELADMPVTPTQAAKRILDGAEDSISRNLPKAIAWLDKFKTQWEKRLDDE